MMAEVKDRRRKAESSISISLVHCLRPSAFRNPKHAIVLFFATTITQFDQFIE
jgi:hypothetical protein